MAQPLRQIQGGALERRRGSRRRFKYWRRHTPHFYLALTAIAAASLLSLSDGIAFLIGGVVLCGIAFAMTGVTAIAVFSAYFWGFFMVMNGNIPLARIKVFIPHAVVGSLIHSCTCSTCLCCSMPWVPKRFQDRPCYSRYLVSLFF